MQELLVGPTAFWSYDFIFGLWVGAIIAWLVVLIVLVIQRVYQTCYKDCCSRNSR